MSRIFREMRDRFFRDKRALISPEKARSSTIRQAMTVLDSNYLEPGIGYNFVYYSTDPSTIGVRFKDYVITADIPYRLVNGLNGDLLANSYVRVIRETHDPKKAQNFARMVMDMPVLYRPRVMEATYALAFNGWNYTSDLQAVVRNPRGTLLTEEQVTAIVNDRPWLFPVMPAEGRALIGDLVQGTRDRGSRLPNETAQVKAHFQESLQNAGYKI